MKNARAKRAKRYCFSLSNMQICWVFSAFVGLSSLMSNDQSRNVLLNCNKRSHRKNLKFTVDNYYYKTGISRWEFLEFYVMIQRGLELWFSIKLLQKKLPFFSPCAIFVNNGRSNCLICLQREKTD